MENFPEMAPAMLERGAAHPVADEADLARALDRLLGDPAEVARRGAEAQAFAESQAHSLPAVADLLEPWLRRAEAAHAGA